MRIENRRSKVEYVVTKEEWAKMVQQQVSSLYRVIDKEDNIRGRINIPKEISEFKITRPERIAPKVQPSEQDMKDAEELLERQMSKSKQSKQ